MAEDKLQVRVEFETDLLKKFNALRKYFGVEGGADLVRFLVNDKHRQVFGVEEKEGVSGKAF